VLAVPLVVAAGALVERVRLLEDDAPAALEAQDQGVLFDVAVAYGVERAVVL